MAYRPAIDGLRAIAVILVLLFHAKAPFFSGGYVGVDVFFVISGYLITSIIVREHDRAYFSFSGFYERRVRRILPALFVVMLATAALAVFVMVPADLRRFGASAGAATVFVANFFFWKHGENYLAGNTESMPLLHTWSLGIEEQFYLAFPVLMIILLRFFNRDVVRITAVIALLSFSLSVYLSLTHPRAAYYFSPGRAWELLLGTLLAVSTISHRIPRRARPFIQWSGLVLIVGCAALYDTQTRFPGSAALAPCLGAAALIVWSDERTSVNRLLSFPVLVWCGLLSYSLYLWHWPLLVLAKLELLRPLSGEDVVLIYAVAIALAIATRTLIEHPIQERQFLVSTRALLGSVCCAAVAIALTGAYLYTSNGLLGKPPVAVEQIMAASNDYAPMLLPDCHNWEWDTGNDDALCHIGADDGMGVSFALWGDSQAGSMILVLRDAATNLGVSGIVLTADNCPPLLHTEVIVLRATLDCQRRNDAALEIMLRLGIQRVVLVGQWFQYLEGPFGDIGLRPASRSQAPEDGVGTFQSALRDTIRELEQAGIEVSLIGPVPFIGWDVPNVVAARVLRNRDAPSGPMLSDVESSQDGVLPFFAQLQQDGVRVHYPHRILCTPVCDVIKDGSILYRDNEHLTTRGAALLQPLFERVLASESAVGQELRAP